MRLIAIYYRPHDAPGGFVLREWRAIDRIVSPGKLLAADVETLDKARLLVPSGMVNAGRHPKDDAKLVEVWVKSDGR